MEFLKHRECLLKAIIFLLNSGSQKMLTFHLGLYSFVVRESRTKPGVRPTRCLQVWNWRPFTLKIQNPLFLNRSLDVKHKKNTERSFSLTFKVTRKSLKFARVDGQQRKCGKDIIDLVNRNLSRKTCSSSTRARKPCQWKIVRKTWWLSKRAENIDERGSCSSEAN